MRSLEKRAIVVPIPDLLLVLSLTLGYEKDCEDFV